MALLAAVLGACSDDASSPQVTADPEPSVTSAAPSVPAVDPDTGEPLRAYDVTLTVIGPSARAEQPTAVQISNVGRNADRYLVAISPPGAAFADREQIRLAPGAQTVVQVFTGGQGVSVQIFSAGASTVLAQQSLPPLPR